MRHLLDAIAFCAICTATTLLTGCQLFSFDLEPEVGKSCDDEGDIEGRLVCRDGEWQIRDGLDQGMAPEDMMSADGGAFEDMSRDMPGMNLDMGADLSVDMRDEPVDMARSPDMTDMADMAPACDGRPAVISPQMDDRAIRGGTYRVLPRVQTGAVSRWRKSYGPDAASVDATTGELTWDVPAEMIGESFYVGVRGEDVCGGFVEDVWIVTVGDGNILRAGPFEQYNTLNEAFNAAQGGDTIILGPGEYTGMGNSMDAGGGPERMVRSGSPELGFTTVIASDPGQSVIVDSQVEWVGKWETELGGAFAYVALKGIHAKQGIALSRGADSGTRPHHIKISDVISEGGIDIARGDDVIVEGCAAFGGAHFMLRAADSNRVVFRRCVIRKDHASVNAFDSFVQAGVATAFNSNDVVFQNVLNIDSDMSGVYVQDPGPLGAFSARARGVDMSGLRLDRVMVLGAEMPAITHETSNQGTLTASLSDVVAWNVRLTSARREAIQCDGDVSITGATLGLFFDDVGARDSSTSWSRGAEGNDTLSNAFFSTIEGPLFTQIEALSYLAFHEANDYTVGGTMHQTSTFIDVPMRQDALEHLPQAKPGGPLEGAGSDGKDIGARVMTFVGRSGTFHGEPGWDEETGISMWPYPNEELIAQKMRAYSYDGPVNGGADMVSVSGDRGFARQELTIYGGPRTLTSYVWEYLGYPCPPDICTP